MRGVPSFQMWSSDVQSDLLRQHQSNEYKVEKWLMDWLVAQLHQKLHAVGNQRYLRLLSECHLSISPVLDTVQYVYEISFQKTIRKPLSSYPSTLYHALESQRLTAFR